MTYSWSKLKLLWPQEFLDREQKIKLLLHLLLKLHLITVKHSADAFFWSDVEVTSEADTFPASGYIKSWYRWEWCRIKNPLPDLKQVQDDCRENRGRSSYTQWFWFFIKRLPWVAWTSMFLIIIGFANCIKVKKKKKTFHFLVA